MREELVALGKLAAMDASARDYDVELKELPARIGAMRQDVDTLEAMLTRERSLLEEAKSLHTQQTAELKSRTDGLARAKAKAAKARNLKEADAAEREVDANRRAIKEREDEIARLDSAIEQKTKSLAERESQFEEAQGMFQEEETKAKTRLAEVESIRSEVLAGRDDVAAKISKRVMKRYDRYHKGRGTAVVLISSRTCPSCRMSLPAQLFIEVQRGETLTQCPHCNMIVIHADLVADPSDAPSQETTAEA